MQINANHSRRPLFASVRSLAMAIVLITGAATSVTALPPTTGDDTCQAPTGPSSGTPCTTNANCTFPEVCGNKSRYISVTPDPAPNTSIQIQIVSMWECAGGVNVGRGCEPGVAVHCPSSSCIPSPRVGEIWWAGLEGTLNNSPQAALRGSQVQCSATPANAQTWTTGVLHLYGTPIVPFASYNVRTCDALGGSCSGPLLVATGDWSDIVRPFGGPSQPNFDDINETIFKFINLGSSQPMPRVDLGGTSSFGTPNTPNQVANFVDISACADAFTLGAFPYTVPACP